MQFDPESPFPPGLGWPGRIDLSGVYTQKRNMKITYSLRGSLINLSIRINLMAPELQ